MNAKVEMPAEIRLAAERTLSDKEFAAFVLSWLGCGYRMVGNVLGVGATTARDRIARANQKVAKELGRGEAV